LATYNARFALLAGNIFHSLCVLSVFVGDIFYIFYLPKPFSMNRKLHNGLLSFLFLFCSFTGLAQTQEEFDKKLNDIYILNATDKKKALQQAKDLYTLLEKKKELQTLGNYYILKNLFENFTVDEALAKTCAEKADRKSREMVGLEGPKAEYGSDSMNLWYNSIYPGLYETKDPENARKALAFMDKYSSFRTLANYTGVGYAFERNGDFNNAKKYYEYGISLRGDERKEYVSYLTYILFLSKFGDYQKAESFIRKVEELSQTADETLKMSYRNEALSAHTLYYYYIGDYESYVKSSDIQYAELAKMFATYKMPCTGQEYIRLTNAGIATEFLKDYPSAEKYWRKRDSAYSAWIRCQKEQYPNLKLYDFSMLPIFLMKRGREKMLPKSLDFYVKEVETYYNSFRDYADLSSNYFRGIQLAFLKSPKYTAVFTPILERIRNTKDFRESTKPFTDFAYFQMRDGNKAAAIKTYQELFTLNKNWVNDIIFAFGEKAFVTYYNAKLKEGYDNFHSFVKTTKDKKQTEAGMLAAQAYDNLLFVKSISLQGTKKRKEAFIKSNDPAVIALYEKWLDKKQQLIRLYFKSAEPAAGPVDTSSKSAEKILETLQAEVTSMENELTVKSKDYKKLLQINPPGWKEIKSKLKEGEAAVEIIRFQWRDQVYYSDTAFYAAYILTNQSEYPEVVYLADDAALLDNQYYKTYKNNIRFRTEDKVSYTLYWKKIQEKLSGIRKVYLSPDGIYHLINVSTLLNPVSGKYVLDELEIQSTTSTGELALAASSMPANPTAVLFGRPAYKTTAATASRVEDEGTRSFIGNFREKNITDLPGTETEVLSIKTELEKGKIKVQYYLKDQATEDKLYKMHSPGILHIATHGYWSGTSENATSGYRMFNAMVNSGLLLAGVVNYYERNEFADTYDGVLTAYEAQNLDLQNTSLVILSACETNLGYLDAGEGVYGLQRAFRAAGAGSIMTSLWKVDDNATRDFMIAFYQQYLATGNKARAFAAAQKTIRDQYKHPYFWGAFVMVGE